MAWCFSCGQKCPCFLSEEEKAAILLDREVNKIRRDQKSFLSSLERITEDCYIPTAQDVPRSHLPTTGIREYCFSMQKID